MNCLRLPVLLFSVAVLSACAMDVANRYYDATPHPPKDPAKVRILRSEPRRPYRVIADFQSRWESPEAMRDKAARIGADAVIISQPGGSYLTSQQWAGHDALRNSSPRICGTAIIYK